MTLAEGEYLFIYNSNSITDKRTKSYTASLSDDVKINEHDIYKDPLTPTQIAEVADLLNVEISELYQEDGDHANAYSDAELLRILSKDPGKMKTPIILSTGKSFFVGSTYDLIQKNVQPFSDKKTHKH